MRISDWSSDVCSSDLGGAVDFLPAAIAIHRRELLKLGRDFGECLAPAPLAQLAVGKKPTRGGDAAQLQAFALQRLVALADDELGGAATNIDDQPVAARWRGTVGDPEIDQPCFFTPGNHFDGKIGRAHV